MELATCSVLFCDIAQSTRYASVLGELEYGELLQAYQEVGQRACQRFCEGRATDTWEYDIRGDQVCVIAFGEPDQDARDLLELARYLKVEWLFSSYNHSRRINQKRAPVPIMIGMHTGEVALGKFARKDTRSAEGYMISIAKRVESCARTGKSTQIMLTDSTIERLGPEVPVGYVRTAEANLTDGLSYPVNEIVEIDPEFPEHVGERLGRPWSQEDNYLRDVVRLDPTSWHRMLWSQWNRSYQPPEGRRDHTCHELALLSNPHAVDLARKLAHEYLGNGDPWRARILIDQAESRAGDRRFDLAQHNLMRAVAAVMIECEKGQGGDWRQVFAHCASAERINDWKAAAHLIKGICVAEGYVLPNVVALPQPSTEMLRLVHDGLNLLRAGEVSPKQLTTWQSEVRTIAPIWYDDLKRERLEVIVPLISFYAKRYIDNARGQVYQTMLLW